MSGQYLTLEHLDHKICYSYVSADFTSELHTTNSGYHLTALVLIYELKSVDHNTSSCRDHLCVRHEDESRVRGCDEGFEEGDDQQHGAAQGTQENV